MKRKKNIWFFSHHSTPPEFGQFARHYNLGKELIRKGYQATVFAGSVPHNSDTQLIPGNEKFIEYDKTGVPYVFIKTCLYNHSGKKRLQAMIQHTRRLFSVTKKIAKKQGKPDVIIASSPHPLTCVAGIFIAKRYKVPCYVEVRDLWPESIVAYSNKYTRKSFVIKCLATLEKWLYTKADKIIFLSPNNYQYIIEREWQHTIPKKKCYYLSNGVNLESFYKDKNEHKITDEHLENTDLIKFVYIGSIRKVNNLGYLLDIAKEVTNSKIAFLVWGKGDQLENLNQRIVDEGIKNVFFKGSVDKRYIPYIMSKSDINLLHNGYSDILRFGISWNKLFDYYASRKPFLATIPIPNPEFNDSFCKVSKSKDKSEVLKNINEMVENLNVLNKNADTMLESLAIEYDFKNLSEKLSKIIEDKRD